MKPRRLPRRIRDDGLTPAIVLMLALVAVNVVLMAPALVLYEYGHISANQFTFIDDSAFELSFSLSVLVYFVFYRKYGFRRIAAELGLGKNTFGLSKLLIGISIFIVIFALEIAVGVLSSVTNVQVNTNIGLVLNSAPLWFLVATAIVFPINEEILFRGFLVNRPVIGLAVLGVVTASIAIAALSGGTSLWLTLAFVVAFLFLAWLQTSRPKLQWNGILISAVVFASGHLAYNSTFEIEVIAAFVFGVVAGYVFKRTKSLYPSIVGHILVNASSILLSL